MQFKVPQFLEIEDKIFGPLTFREFVYLAGGAGLCFTAYKLLGFLLGIVPILIIAGFALMLTFYKPNNKPFVNMLESGFRYLSQGKLYIWKKEGKKEPLSNKKLEIGQAKKETQMAPHKLTEGKLRDLSWSLNVLDLSKQKKD